MQNHIKERILGSTILLGGGILMSALLLRNDEPPRPADEQIVLSNEQVEKNNQPISEELTASYEVEQQLLAEKKAERAKKIAEREASAEKLMQEQLKARDKALAKAEAEQVQSNASEEISEAEVQTEYVEDESVITLQPEYTPEQIEEQKQQYEEQQEQAKRFLEEAQAEAENVKQLQEQQALLELQRQKQRAAEEQARKEKEKKRRAEESRKKAEAAKQKAEQEKIEKQKKSTSNYIAARNELKAARKQANPNDKRYAVQIALAANQENADALANSLKKHGYKVSTTPTSRGVRVIVGPEKGEKAAYSLRKKLQSDKRINVTDAWIADYNKVHVKSAQKKANTDVKKTQKPQLDKTKKNTSETKKATQDASTNPDIKYQYSVQVALAGTATSRDALITKLKKNGYRVTTSHTSRGTRILVGAGSTKEDALKLQQKINSDKRIGISGAWIKRQRKRN